MQEVVDHTRRCQLITKAVCMNYDLAFYAAFTESVTKTFRSGPVRLSRVTTSLDSVEKRRLYLFALIYSALEGQHNVEEESEQGEDEDDVDDDDNEDE
jgi:hypothetical protein